MAQESTKAADSGYWPCSASWSGRLLIRRSVEAKEDLELQQKFKLNDSIAASIDVIEDMPSDLVRES